MKKVLEVNTQIEKKIVNIDQVYVNIPLCGTKVEEIK